MITVISVQNMLDIYVILRFYFNVRKVFVLFAVLLLYCDFYYFIVYAVDVSFRCNYWYLPIELLLFSYMSVIVLT
jgi:hypothetical protein